MAQYMRQMSLEHEITDSICSTEGPPVRAVKLAASKARPRFVADGAIHATSSLQDDLGLVADLFHEDQACAVVVSFSDGKVASKDQETQWHVVTWIPESTPAKDKQMWSMCAAALKRNFPCCSFKELEAVSIQDGLITVQPCREDVEDDKVTLLRQRKSKCLATFDLSDPSDSSTACSSGGSDIEDAYQADWSAHAPPPLEASDPTVEVHLPVDTTTGVDAEALGEGDASATAQLARLECQAKPLRFECKQFDLGGCLQQ